MKNNTAIIGIDGGATKISGGIVKKINKTTFSICLLYTSDAADE